MRVDPNYISNLSATLSQSTLQEAQLTNELSSGLRVTQLGDDPVAAAQALQLGSAISRADTFVQTATRESGALQVADSTLGEVVTQLTSAISLATQGANGTLSASNRVAIVNQLQDIQKQILSLGNTSYLGTHLFSGSQGNTAPFVQDPVTGAVTYQGDAVQNTVQTPSGQPLVTSLTGSSVFQAAGGDVFGALSTVIADLTANAAGASSGVDTGALSAALANVSEQRSVLGSSANRLLATSTYTQAQETTLKAQQGTLVSSDYAAVATELKSAETQHSALISLIAALSKGSLFDYLK